MAQSPILGISASYYGLEKLVLVITKKAWHLARLK
jgi:hypothetical protein